IAILGAGMVARAIYIDLAHDHTVTSFDINSNALEILSQKNDLISTVQKDLNDHKNYPAMLKDFDLVVNAVPGFIGYKTLEAVINAGKDLVDISFFPEDALLLDKLAKEKNVTAI